ncbi:helix-turn-helix domain-containing protein, partial [Subtercola boreus]
MRQRPELTLSEVVERFEISRATLKRRLAAGELVGAHKDRGGVWRIPIEALQAAQIAPKKTWLADLGQIDSDLGHELGQELSPLEIRVSQLERDLAHELGQR